MYNVVSSLAEGIKNAGHRDSYSTGDLCVTLAKQIRQHVRFFLMARWHGTKGYYKGLCGGVGDSKWGIFRLRFLVKALSSTQGLGICA